MTNTNRILLFCRPWQLERLWSAMLWSC